MAALVGAALMAVASSTPVAGQAKPKASGERIAVPELITDAPYEIPSLGLSVFLPKDSLVDQSRLQAGPTSVMVRPQGGSTPWVFQIQSSTSTDREMQLKTALNNIVAQRKGQYSRKDDRGNAVSLVREFGRTDELMIGPYKAERVYLDVPSRPDVPTSGYTLFETGPGQFVIFQIDCVTDAFPALQSLYETMVATVQFRDPGELRADRAAAILTGTALLQKFNKADLGAALDAEPRFYRLYKPAATGAPGDAQEIGYQRIQAKAGKAGELDPDKSPTRWTSADQREGYIVRIDARTLAMGAVVDTVTIFFLSTDRKQELWSNTMVVRKSGDTEQWIETGIRRDKALTVKTTRSGGEPTSADWSPVPEGYISRVETYLLPRLVVGAKTSGDFGFYSYESGLAKMTLRRDSFEAPSSPGGFWKSTTLQSENSPPIVTTLDADGRTVRREMKDGSVMEPVDAARLRKLWQDKKLPLD